MNLELIVKPASVEEVRSGVEKLREGGHTVHPRVTFDPGDARRFAAEAEMDDRLLDVCIVEAMGHLEFAKLAPQLRAGRHVDHPRVTDRKLRSLTVDADQDFTVNADGEPLTARRFEYAFAPAASP